MTRIAFIQVHAENDLTIEPRTKEFAEKFARFGYDTAIYALTKKNPHLDPADAVASAAGISASHVTKQHFFRTDDASVEPAKRSSKDMVEAVCQWSPHVVIFKGLGYASVDLLVERLRGKAAFGAILGGAWYSKANKEMDFFFIEYETQKERIIETFGKGDAFFELMPKFIPWDVLIEQEPPGRDYDICNVGSFSDRKNQRALAPLFDLARIVFLGVGPNLDEVKKIAENRSNVLFLGYKSPAEVIATIRRSKIMVHTSTWEGLPRVAIEAFASGTPLIALRKTLQDALGHLDFVTLVEECEIKDAVMQLLADPRKWSDYSSASADYARRHHGPQRLEEVAARFHANLGQFIAS